MRPPAGLRRMLETCLYVEDLSRARQFYQRVLGLEAQFADERMTAFRIGDTMLLLFARDAGEKPVDIGTGVIPTHRGDGPAHLAISVDREAIVAWRAHLADTGVELESEVEWPNWHTSSLYFRDPDGHLVELAGAGLWGID